MKVILQALLLSNLILLDNRGTLPVVYGLDDAAPQPSDDHLHLCYTGHLPPHQLWVNTSQCLQYHSYKNHVIQSLVEHSYLSTLYTRMSPITEKDVVDLLQQLHFKHEEQNRKLEEDYQLMVQQAVAGAGDTIAAALAPLTARQEQYKHTMDERINKIHEDVSNISKL